MPAKVKVRALPKQPVTARSPTPKPKRAAEPVQATPRRLVKPVPTAKTVDLSTQLLGLLADSQKKAPAPLGMVKCPVCGTPIAPTRNQRIRTHDDPLKVARCAGSGQRWELFGAQPAPAKDGAGTKAAQPKVGRTPVGRKAPRKVPARKASVSLKQAAKAVRDAAQKRRRGT